MALSATRGELDRSEHSTILTRPRRVITAALVVAAAAASCGDTGGTGTVDPGTRPSPTEIASVPSQRLLASDGVAGDMLGGARWYDTYATPVRPVYYATPGQAALSSDGTVAVVGAPGAAVDGKPGAGAAYVYTRRGRTWSQSAKLVAPDGRSYDALGWTVAISGDGRDVLAGTPFADGSVGDDAGAAYLFHLAPSATAATSTTRLVAEDPRPYDEFGWSVAIAREGGTAAIGAPGRTVKDTPGAGAVFVIRRTAPNRWAQVREIPVGRPAADGQFGSALDLSADGATLVATEATHRDEKKVMHTGSLVIFRTTTAWRTATQVLKQADPSRNADGESTAFGVDVTVSDDGRLAAVASPDVNIGRALGTGNALLYGTTCSWRRPACTTVRILRPAMPSPFQYYGSAVALDAAGTRLFIGNDGGGTNGQGEGELVRITRSASDPVRVTARVTFRAPDRTEARFGTAVAITADGTTGLATSPWLDVGRAVDQGGAYIIELPDAGGSS